MKKELLIVVVMLFLVGYTQAEPPTASEEALVATDIFPTTLKIKITPGVELDVEALLEDILMATLDQYPEIAEAGFQVTEKPGILVLEFFLSVPQAVQLAVLDILSPFEAIFTIGDSDAIPPLTAATKEVTEAVERSQPLDEKVPTPPASRFPLQITIPPGVELNVEALVNNILKILFQHGEMPQIEIVEKPNTLVLVFDRTVSQVAQREVLDILSPLKAVFRGGNCVAIKVDEADALAAASKVLPSVVVVSGSTVKGIFGTGFIISSDGYIMTNAHVIKDKEETFEITLYNGRTFPGRLVGYVGDEDPDVGVIKIEGSNLPAVELTDPSTLRCGDPLLLIGHPLGYGYWVITGGQFLLQDGTDLVTDVPAALGNSGGPLINMRGQVVGLLWGDGGVLGKESKQTPPDTVEVLWTWEAFHAMRVHTSSSVAIDKAHVLAEEIITRRANLVSGSLTAEAICKSTGASSQITIPGPVDEPFVLSNREVIDSILQLLDPTVGLIHAQQVADSIVLTFNQPLAPTMCEKFFDLLLNSAAATAAWVTSATPPKLEKAPAPEANASHPQNATALVAAEKVLPSVVAVGSSQTKIVAGGTGSIISPDGYILTNRHVVADNSLQSYGNFQVTLYDGRTLPGRLVGFVENTLDVAVIKVDASGLPAIEFGDSSTLQEGQSLLSIGHPGGYGNWLVTGGEFLRRVKSGILTNIPSGAGGSGSPIVNLQGQMVALLNAGYTGEEPTEIKPNPIRIIWSFPESFNLSQTKTLGEAINAVRTAVDAIIARQGNVP
jgi:S1-C subfamily serine protease